ncbi:MAG TPA: ABC transporter substrate-binding protein [Alphaproteobacteria bacterium]|nr:ABC transporter substrate-binding protein [Alphaproteobacteria bacterium]
MLNRRTLLLSAASAAVGAFVPSRAARAEDIPAAASQFVTVLADKVINVLKDKVLSKDDRVKALAAVFLEGFDVRGIGLFVLGVYGHRASESERASYLNVFKEYVVQTYAVRFNSYAGESFLVTKAAPDGDIGAWVTSGIGKAGEEPTEVQWRVRKEPEGYKIIDVVVEGVSLLVTQRSEFAAVLQRNNGNITSLTELMRDKIVELRAKS